MSNQEVPTNMELYLIEDISNPAPKSPFTSIGASKLQSIRKLADIFKINYHTGTPYTESEQTRLDIKQSNTPMTTSSLRVRIPNNLKNPAPTTRHHTHPQSSSHIMRTSIHH